MSATRRPAQTRLNVPSSPLSTVPATVIGTVCEPDPRGVLPTGTQTRPVQARSSLYQSRPGAHRSGHQPGSSPQVPGPAAGVKALRCAPILRAARWPALTLRRRTGRAASSQQRRSSIAAWQRQPRFRRRCPVPRGSGRHERRDDGGHRHEPLRTRGPDRQPQACAGSPR